MASFQADNGVWPVNDIINIQMALGRKKVPTPAREHQVLTQLLGSLPPTPGSQVEFLAPDYGLARPWLLQAFGGANQQVEDLALSPSASQQY